VAGTEDRHRCSFCGKPQDQAATLICPDGVCGAVYICDGCVVTVMAALTAPGRPIPSERGDVCCSYCGRHQAATRPVHEGPDARICIYCLSRCRELLVGDSRPTVQSTGQTRPWRHVLREMSRLVEEGRVVEFAARLGFTRCELDDDVRPRVADAVRQFRGLTGLGWQDFASMVRRETGDREPTADQLVAWETGWESPPMDVMLKLACVATAHSRARTCIGAGWHSSGATGWLRSGLECERPDGT
jgi:hypothetical protein